MAMDAKAQDIATILSRQYEIDPLQAFQIGVILLPIHQARVIPHLIGGLSDFDSEEMMPAVNTDEWPRQFSYDLSRLTWHSVAWFYPLTPGCSAPSSY